MPAAEPRIIPRGLSRDEAASYIGVGATKFDELVAENRMPRPKCIGSRKVWDRLALDAAFSDLPEDLRAQRGRPRNK